MVGIPEVANWLSGLGAASEIALSIVAKGAVSRLGVTGGVWLMSTFAAGP
jgi:hypothetical protein